MYQGWTLYILKCGDDTLYTGVTNNLQHRLDTHRSGKGAKYVRSRLPITVVYTEVHPDRSSAQKREMEIKGWSRAQKIADLSLEL